MRAIAWATATAVATLLATAADARACSCAGAWSLVAPLSAEHPSGAPLVLESACGGSLDAWSVTVDGAAADFDDPVFHGEIVTVPIVPAPDVGAEVVVTVDCSRAGGDPACAGDDAPIERARFTVGPPDTIAPPPALAVTWEFLDDLAEGDCARVDGKRTIRASVEIGEREPGSWVELVLERADDLGLAHSSRPIPTDGGVVTLLFGDEEALEFPEICVDAVVHDAAGNVSEVVQDCVVETDTGDPGFAIRGCVCAATPGRAREGLLLGLLLVIVVRTRTSRRRSARLGRSG